VESKLGPLGTSATEWPIVPAPGDYDYKEFGGMKIGRGNPSTRRKPAPTLLCPPQIPLDQTRDRTRAAAVGSQLSCNKIIPILNTNRVLRRIFGPKRDKVTGDWRKLQNEELHNLHSSPSIIRVIKLRGRNGQGM
jgi:hypothetical protein